MEIIIAGFGGQGIMLAAYIAGKAATIYENKEAVFQESYGPEARGSACKASLVISEEPIDYPFVEDTDILIALSKEGYSINSKSVRDGGIVIYDSSLVQGVTEKKRYGVEATMIAEGLHNKIAANMVILGFFVAVTGVLRKESIKKSIETTVSKRFLEMNLKAFEAGYERGLDAKNL